MQKRRCAAGWGLVTLGVTGCGGAAAEPDATSRSQALATAPDAGSSEGVAPANGATLLAPQSCDELLAALHADLFARTRRQADRARQWPYGVTPEEYTGGVVSNTAPSPAPRGATPGGEVPGAIPFDEGDTVKADRDRLYMLDTANAAQRLVVVRAASEQPLAVLATVPIEGTPLELLSHDGRLLVFSRIEGALPEIYEGFPRYEPVFTKLTLLDFDTEADTGAATGTDTESTPRIERELYLEGEYVFARQQGSVVRAVIQLTPKLLLDAPLLSDTDILGNDRPQAQIDAQVDAWVAITDASVQSSGLDAYLPGVYERQGGLLVTRAPSCDSTFVPEPGRMGPGALSVFSLDLDAIDLTPGTPVAATSASAGTPLSSFTVFGYPDGIALDPGAAIIHQSRRADGPGEAPRGESLLHLFELDAAEARYAAAGSITGYVSTIDRQAGELRVLASQSVYVEDRFRGHERRALTLAVEGERLRELGSTLIETANDGLGAVSFVGDHAYLHTTNVVGPGFGPATAALVALDLSDPAAPREAGRLPLPSSSRLLLPIPGARLLSIASVPEPDETNAHPEIWLFDVGGPGAPGLGVRYAWPPPSTVIDDPRNLSFSPDGARFGLPVTGAFSSSFDVFGLSESGLTRLASIERDGPEPTLVPCLELHGLPTDPESIAALEADPAALARELGQCELDWPRSYVQRGLLRASDALVLSLSYRDSRWTVARYPLSALDAPPQSQVDF